MPWPMVHFCIAEQVWKQDLTSELLLGSVAPDAIHMREGTTRQDKGRTHLCQEDGTMPDLAVIQRFCEVNLSSTDQRFRHFIMGYAAHILTDLRWTETVWQAFVEKIGQQDHEPNEPIKNIYNREVCQLEYHLLRSEEWADRALTSLLHSTTYPLPPLLTEREITLYGERVVRNLRDGTIEPRILPFYITDDIVKKFIDRTSVELKELAGMWDGCL